ncbi:GtrA family protein [Novosphingobium huizhouense]|uniref:GtrA family protein n=1 Tax=Novosphingobium huizhouense TaxID=2866625 RepID=UPI001CD8AC49|nr:GtrA family protein [Novosphingobium huizhouense]
MPPFARFALVGAAGFVVDAGVLTLARSTGAGLLAGRALSYLVAATFTWGCNRRFTFAATQAPSVGEWARFLLVNAGGGLVNLAVYSALVLALPPVARMPVLGVAAGSLAGLAVNFALSRRFVFRA